MSKDTTQDESRDNNMQNVIHETAKLNINSNNNSNTKENLSINIHDKAYKYLESLEIKYPNELDNMYEKAGLLMEIVREAADFDTGLKNAIEQYKITKGDDKDFFILIQFLEEFYGRYAIFDQYHTQEVHENNFKIALNLAYNAVDNHSLLEQIYNSNIDLMGDSNSPTI